VTPTTIIVSAGIMLPLAMVAALLGWLGFVSSQQLVYLRRYVIVAAFVLVASLTPPDAIGQLSLAIPIVLLYEGSIRAVRIVENS
jgi:sec-independent protein translocase protein TatC